VFIGVVVVKKKLEAEGRCGIGRCGDFGWHLPGIAFVFLLPAPTRDKWLAPDGIAWKTPPEPLTPHMGQRW
jgi:hypothetical protein